MNARLLAVLLVAAPAAAAPVQFSAAVSAGSQIFTQRAYDAVDGDDMMPSFGVGVTASFPVPVGLIDVELAFIGASTHEMLHSNVPVELMLRCPTVGAAWRLPLYRFFQPYVKLALGIDVATLTVLSPQQLQQTVANPAGTGMLGVQVPLVLYRGTREPTLLADVGFGYTVRPDYTFAGLTPPAPSSPTDQPIAHGTTNMGTLPLSGFMFRIALAFRI